MPSNELTRVLIERICNMTFETDPQTGLPDATSPTGEIWKSGSDHRDWLFTQTDTTGLLTGDKEYVAKALTADVNISHMNISHMNSIHKGVVPERDDKNNVTNIATTMMGLNVMKAGSQLIYDCMKAKIDHAHEDGARSGLILLARAIYNAYQTNQTVVDAVVTVGTVEHNKLGGAPITEAQFRTILTTPTSLLYQSHDW